MIPGGSPAPVAVAQLLDVRRPQSAMFQTVEFDLDERAIKLAHSAYVSKASGFTIPTFLRTMVPFILVGVVFLLFGGNWRYAGAAVIAVGLALGVASGSVLWRTYRKKMSTTREVLGRMSRPHFRFQFTDEGVHSQTELHSGQVAWKGFRELHRTPDVWLLFITKTRYVVFPTTYLPSELQTFIVQKCHEHKIPVA